MTEPKTIHLMPKREKEFREKAIRKEIHKIVIFVKRLMVVLWEGFLVVLELDKES